MSVGIVCMVNNTALKKPTTGNVSSSVDENCYFNTTGSTVIDGPFVWNSGKKYLTSRENILFFW